MPYISKYEPQIGDFIETKLEGIIVNGIIHERRIIYGLKQVLILSEVIRGNLPKDDVYTLNWVSDYKYLNQFIPDYYQVRTERLSSLVLLTRLVRDRGAPNE